MRSLKRARKGEWKVNCQRCGFDYYASETDKEWNGLRVCETCWERRHPQDFVRGKRDDQSPPFTSPAPEPVFGSRTKGDLKS